MGHIQIMCLVMLIKLKCEYKQATVKEDLQFKCNRGLNGHQGTTLMCSNLATVLIWLMDF